LRGCLRGFAREDISSAAAAVGDISCHDDSVGYATRVKILNTEIVGTFRERADR
jgi:hypothetical protein